jgi:hypothetical protein
MMAFQSCIGREPPTQAACIDICNDELRLKKFFPGALERGQAAGAII